MARKPAPRIAGRRLRALAALLRAPMAGARLADFFLEAGGARRLRQLPRESPPRAVIQFRAGPRRPPP